MRIHKILRQIFYLMKKYERTPISERLEALEYLKKHSISATSEAFDVSESKLMYWQKNEKKYKEVEDKDTRKSTNLGNKVKYADLEDLLYKWVISKRSKGEPINTNVIIIKAKKLLIKFV